MGVKGPLKELTGGHAKECRLNNFSNLVIGGERTGTRGGGQEGEKRDESGGLTSWRH